MSHKNRITLSTYRVGGKAFVQWNHSDGPMLVCSNGHPHWLTLWERVKLFIGLDSIESLDAFYTKAKQSGGEG